MSAFRSGARWRYGRYDGRGASEAPHGREIFDDLVDDLAYHGDVEAALRRLLREGFEAGGVRTQGLRELLDQLRRRRSELSARELSGVADEIIRALDEVLALEHQGIDEQAAAAVARGDDRAEQAGAAAERHAELDLLPDGLAERLQALRQHEFVSSEAAQRFARLMDQLRHDLAQLRLDAAAAALREMDPSAREHLREGLSALNRMLDQRAHHEELDPSFAEFIARFGDLFGSADSLEELLERIGRQMAAASAFLASLDPEQRAELEALSEELLGDLDLAFQLDQLGAHLRAELPGLAWDQPMATSPGPPLGLGEAGQLFAQLNELRRLEELLSSATSPGALGEVDPDAVRELLGEDAATSLETLAELARRLEAEKLVARRGGRLAMTPQGLRRLGQKALAELFSSLDQGRLGDHGLEVAGLGHDFAGETKPYEYGDPFRLEVQASIRNALRRLAGSGPIAPPIRLHPDDFEVERAEQVASASTVLALDLSLSMQLEDNFLAAKKVAMALQALIASRYPRDYLGLVGFAAYARVVRPDELPELTWDFGYGTNLQHALVLARQMLAKRDGTKQVVLITDGEPTAHLRANGEVDFHYPPTRATLAATLAEVDRCTRAAIAINTFALASGGGLRDFVEEMTRRNRGRAFFTSSERLGDYVLVDFLSSRGTPRRRRLRRGA